MSPQCCESIGELGVKNIVCAERWLLILTLTGKVYIMYYSSETQVIFFQNNTAVRTRAQTNLLIFIISVQSKLKGLTIRK